MGNTCHSGSVCAPKSRQSSSKFLIENKNQAKNNAESTVNSFFNACWAGDKTKIEALLELNPNLVFAKDQREFIKCQKEWTGMHYAVLGGKKEVCELLLEKGAYINSQNEDGDTPLMTALINRKEEVARFLTEKGAHLSHTRTGKTVLMGASEAGLLGFVNFFLHNEEDVNRVDDNGWTALMFASSKGHTPVVKVLCDAGASLNVKERSEGATALHLASSSGHKFVVEMLCAAGAFVNLQDDIRGQTSIHRASKCGHQQVVEVLCEANAALDVKDCEGSTPLHLASHFGNEVSVKNLCDAGAQMDCKDINGKAPLHHASAEGNTAVVEMLCSFGALRNLQDNSGNTALHLAIHGGHELCVRALVIAGLDTTIENEEGKNAYDAACDAAEIDDIDFDENDDDSDVIDEDSDAPTDYNQVFKNIIHVIEQAQIDQNEKTNQRLIAAFGLQSFVEACNLENEAERLAKVTELLKREAYLVNMQEWITVIGHGNKWWTPLQYVCHCGVHSVVGLLVECKAGVNIQDNLGDTALMLASASGHSEIVELLITAGARQDIQNNFGDTALMKAFATPKWPLPRRHTVVVRSLIFAGAKLDIENVSGMTALIVASGKGDAAVIQALISAGASVNFSTQTGPNAGLTALHWAAWKGDEACVNALVMCGANVSAKFHGMTAVDYARKGRRMGAFEILSQIKTASEVPTVAHAHTP